MADGQLPKMVDLRRMLHDSAHRSHDAVERRLRELGLNTKADDYRSLVRKIEDLEGEAYGIIDEMYMERSKLGDDEERRQHAEWWLNLGHDPGDEDRDGEIDSNALWLRAAKTATNGSYHLLPDHPDAPAKLPHEIRKYDELDRKAYEEHMGPIVTMVVIRRRPLARQQEVPLNRPQWRYTCHNCPLAYGDCDYVYDDYNTDGDCLAMK